MCIEPDTQSLTPSTSDDWLQQIGWNDVGLVPVVTQCADSGDVLMMAYMNHDAVAQTLRRGFATYWSRSRQRLWQKGESSGNQQRVRGLYLDCDGDALLLEVEQMGRAACHTGRRSCFYRAYNDGQWDIVAPVLTDPDRMYGPS